MLSSFIPEDERIVTIEDAAELQLQQAHVVRLETRPPNIEGKGEVTIRDLVRNALRMRPDRIIVGEVRGGEALDMLQAMNTGHDGSLTTVHANSPRDALSRLETMVLMAGMDLPVRAIREQVSRAIHLIVHQARLRDGSRRITHITEIEGMEGDVITLQDLFVFDFAAGIGTDGRYLGRLKSTGIRPAFLPFLKNNGVTVPDDVFAFETYDTSRLLSRRGPLFRRRLGLALGLILLLLSCDGRGSRRGAWGPHPHGQLPGPLLLSRRPPSCCSSAAGSASRLGDLAKDSVTPRSRRQDRAMSIRVAAAGSGIAAPGAHGALMDESGSMKGEAIKAAAAAAAPS